MIDGKAKLVSDVYCDGLGACIGDCPTDALKIIERDAPEFDMEKVEERLSQIKKEEQVLPPLTGGCPSSGCPGSASRAIAPEPEAAEAGDAGPSQLGNWPLQLHLVSPQAPYFQNADLLIAANQTENWASANPMLVAETALPGALQVVVADLLGSGERDLLLADPSSLRWWKR